VELDVPVCCVCGSTDSRAICETRDWVHVTTTDAVSFVQCEGCAHVFQSPRVAIEYGHTLYPTNNVMLAEKSLTLLLRVKKLVQLRRIRKLLDYVPPNGTILEVGAGDGVLLTAIRDQRSDIRLIAIDILFSSTTIERLADSRIEMLETPIDALASAENIDVGMVDVVVMNQSIEHLWKPDVVLSYLARVLSKDGRIAVSTPDFDGYDRKLWNQYWGGWYAPRHLNLFTQSAIERLALNCGLCVTHKKHLVAPVIWCHSVGGYLKSRFPNGRLPKRLLKSPIVALLLFAVVDLLARSLRLRTSNIEYVLQRH